jgi:hypothetical protein
MKPTVGRTVHYTSYGTPGGEYASECRAAIITAGPRPVAAGEAVSLAVLNPEGLFFNPGVLFDPGHRGGTWHWPERENEAPS